MGEFLKVKQIYNMLEKLIVKYLAEQTEKKEKIGKHILKICVTYINQKSKLYKEFRVVDHNHMEWPCDDYNPKEGIVTLQQVDNFEICLNYGGRSNYGRREELFYLLVEEIDDFDYEKIREILISKRLRN